MVILHFHRSPRLPSQVKINHFHPFPPFPRGKSLFFPREDSPDPLVDLEILLGNPFPFLLGAPQEMVVDAFSLFPLSFFFSPSFSSIPLKGSFCAA